MTIFWYSSLFNVCLFALVLYVMISNLQNLNLLAGKGPERPKLLVLLFYPFSFNNQDGKCWAFRIFM